ncbi:transmembrane protein 186 [Aricia agestis]|uniref:transmembrane protein 186 n=1 Tax=Aricia agestis TaxID=91739 RepID=UPI001C208910|nr:transmembrane protein 186 [Aricia agestis]
MSYLKLICFTKMSLFKRITNLRYYSNASKITSNEVNFENVFSFPFVRYFALFNKLKVLHFYGSCAAIPTCGLMEIASVFPANTFLSASYIGVTGGVVLSLFSAPFRNIIGHIYISEDNKFIKISSVDFFGKRVDEIIPTDDWIPIMDLKPRKLDPIYLSPTLSNGKRYKWFYKFGIVRNHAKIGEILE